MVLEYVNTDRLYLTVWASVVKGGQLKSPNPIAVSCQPPLAILRKHRAIPHLASNVASLGLESDLFQGKLKPEILHYSTYLD